MNKQTQDPRYEQEILIDIPKRGKGRPEYGRKVIGDKDKDFGDNLRKSRSVWSTSTENELLKQILEVIKYEKDYEKVTLGQIMNDFLRKHPGANIENGERNPAYFQGRYEPSYLESIKSFSED